MCIYVSVLSFVIFWSYMKNLSCLDYLCCRSCWIWEIFSAQWEKGAQPGMKSFFANSWRKWQQLDKRIQISSHLHLYKCWGRPIRLLCSHEKVKFSKIQSFVLPWYLCALSFRTCLFFIPISLGSFVLTLSLIPIFGVQLGFW